MDGQNAKQSREELMLWKWYFIIIGRAEHTLLENINTIISTT